MTGVRNEFIVARKNLIRILRVLGGYDPRSIVVVGAQAIYLRTSNVTLPFAPFTYDSDLVLNPARLATLPSLRSILAANGYVHRENQPGLYWAPRTVGQIGDGSQVDLLVPEELARGSGRRDAGLPGDNVRAARRTPGLEAALFDYDSMWIADLAESLDGIDANVAGPAALVIAKSQKIAERSQDQRLVAKDASDVFRILRGHERGELYARFEKLAGQPECSESIRSGLQFVKEVFVDGSIGRSLFAQVTASEPEGEELRESFRILTIELGEILSSLGVGA